MARFILVSTDYFLFEVCITLLICVRAMQDERTISRQEQSDTDGELAMLGQKSSVKIRIDL